MIHTPSANVLVFSVGWLCVSLMDLTLQNVVGQVEQVDPSHSKKMSRGLDIFKSDVRTILIGRCLKCHGGKETEGDFDLSTREGLIAGGSEGPAVQPGKSSQSRLIGMISHTLQPTMPEDGAKLDPRNIDAIRKWIDLGAPYDKPLATKGNDPLDWTRKEIDSAAKSFWAFRPLQAVKPPEVSGGQNKTVIDRFLLKELHKKRLLPNPTTSREKLVRRAYLDLVGLPPTQKQIQRFLGDDRKNAFALLVDELLDSPHYGERWGRHWLDIARFGESHGFEQDYNRPHAYHYRDFVIKALNSDMPFNQFVQWQIAGDEMAPDEPLALMATGFLGAGVFPTQLTEKEFEPARYDELDDMVSTLGTAMLGLTVGCARCHDHKFDPIPQRDYYQMVSTFSATIRSEVDVVLEPSQTQKEMANWQIENDRLTAAIEKYEKEHLPDRFQKWLDSRPSEASQQPTWIVLEPTKFQSQGGATVEKLDDGSLLVSGKNADFDTYTFIAHTELQGISAIRLDALAHPSMVRGGPGRAVNGNIGLGTFSVSARPLDSKSAPTNIDLYNPIATFQQNTGNLSIASSLDKIPKSGWAIDPQFGKDHSAVFQIRQPLGFPQGIELTITMKFGVNNKHNIGRPRISISTSPQPVGLQGDSQKQLVIESLKLLRENKEPLDNKHRKILFDWYRGFDAQWKSLHTTLQGHIAKKPKPKTTKVMVSSEGLKPLSHHADGRGFPHFYKQAFFLKRGDPAQKQGVAEPGFLQVLVNAKETGQRWKPKPPAGARQSYRRSALAQWIVDTDSGAGQQLARVIVNRIWQHHFGLGIVSTPNDFGFQGQRPSHPELLDWLASQLIKNNWSLKSIHRIIMQTAAYQQSSEFRKKAAGIDPTNKWVWRFQPRRLEAEAIRDSMLAVSGVLDPKLYGPGTLDENMKRRSIYFMIKRSRLIPMMQIFDSPEPLVSVGNRPQTTIAPQALLFMNNPNVRDYARQLALRLITSEKNGNSREEILNNVINKGYFAAVGRLASPLEHQRNLDFIKQQIASYENETKKTDQPDAVQSALIDFCQVLFCLNEFVYLD
jgi:mono/diheme cytochrome c family protein